ncbi:hypothetical protein ABIE26_003215 [Pedobacter africanus]|uniref:Uncharacterized protein n=1 Tax=Pedobacter africanus TaxID=151894 RepID=A0ACC6KYW8_9SPHI|nr:hypothetical protein [Pedobacter africanus]
MPEEISLALTRVAVRKKPHKKNDELLKGAFEENFYDFLRFMYSDADEVIDFEKGIDFNCSGLSKSNTRRENTG